MAGNPIAKGEEAPHKHINTYLRKSNVVMYAVQGQEVEPRVPTGPVDILTKGFCCSFSLFFILSQTNSNMESQKFYMTRKWFPAQL